MATPNIKLVESDEHIEPFHWRPLTHDEYVRVDSQCAGPAKYEDQVHSKFNNDLMKRTLAKFEVQETRRLARAEKRSRTKGVLGL